MLTVGRHGQVLSVRTSRLSAPNPCQPSRRGAGFADYEKGYLYSTAADSSRPVEKPTSTSLFTPSPQVTADPVDPGLPWLPIPEPSALSFRGLGASRSWRLPRKG